MALHTNLPIYKVAYDLLGVVTELVKNMPRDFKQSIGGMTVLEPSVGTGRILQAIMNNDTARAVVAVEINAQLAENIRKEYPLTHVHNQDFLTYERGNFPVQRIIMNPPFANADDIKHIKHALSMLSSGGRLVALCANGSRQREALQPLSSYWEDLPANTFAVSGTGVNVALLTIEG